MARIRATVAHINQHVQRIALYQSITGIALHFVVAFLVTWALTGQAAISGAVAIVEPFACHVAHIGHDRLWRRVLRKLSGRSRQGLRRAHTDAHAHAV
jgi:uncharacterized membrane protein